MASLGVSDLSAQEHHTLYTNILRDHVKNGLVDYQNLKRDPRLNEYIQQLSSSDPEQISSEDARLAFWLNAYNAYTLKIICDNYPLKSISELHTGGLALGTVLKSTVWHKKLVVINNQTTSLDAIEHKIIRKEFNDARIHFALVCAAASCPPLRAEAYEGEKLDQQLDDQARTFLAEPSKNFFDTEKKTAHLSPIFSWFKGDFRKETPTVLDYVIRFLPDRVSDSIRTKRKDWNITYTPYDWSLNEQ